MCHLVNSKNRCKWFWIVLLGNGNFSSCNCIDLVSSCGSTWHGIRCVAQAVWNSQRTFWVSLLSAGIYGHAPPCLPRRERLAANIFIYFWFSCFFSHMFHMESFFGTVLSNTNIFCWNFLCFNLPTFSFYPYGSGDNLAAWNVQNTITCISSSTPSNEPGSQAVMGFLSYHTGRNEKPSHRKP